MSSYSSHTSFHYPPRIRRAVSALSLLVLFLNLAEYLLAWARAFYAWLAAPLQLPQIIFLTPPQNILSMLLTAHLGLAFAVIAADALAFLTPRIALGNNRFVMQTVFGARVIPFTALRGIHSVELSNKRFVVWVESAKGMPLQNLLARLLFGRWLGSGFLLTSDLDGFDDLLATIVAQLKRTYGDANFAAHFSEDKPTWLLSMLFEPRATIRDVSQADTIPISQREAA